MELRWGALPRSRQEQGRVTEARLLKQRGARVHPNSGAGHIKEDGSDEHLLYEVKDARKTFTLNAKDLKTTFTRALRQGKMGVWLVYFSDQDVTVEIRLIPGGRELVGHDD